MYAILISYQSITMTILGNMDIVSILGSLIPYILLYIISESILSFVTGTPVWIIKQSLRWWHEIVYLGSVLRDEGDDERPGPAWWKPKSERYVALQAIYAQTSEKKDLSEPLLEMLDRYLKANKTFLVLGEPGAGKSTVMQALTYRLAKRGYYLSFFLWFLWLMITVLFARWNPLISALLLFLIPPLVIWIHPWRLPFYIPLKQFSGSDINTFFASQLKNENVDEGLVKKKAIIILIRWN